MAIQPSEQLRRAIRTYKSGNHLVFGQIYQLSLPYLTKCTANVVNRVAPGAGKELLEDVLQDTYMTIAEKLDTLQNEEAFFQWAGQIATNQALRVWKQDTRWHEMEQPVDDLVYETPDERFIPEDILENKEKQQLIRSMLQQLPAGQYMCLVEYFYNGLKEKEVAEKLGMPLGTVKTNLSRAKKKLKEIVQTHEKKHGVKLYSMSWLLLVLFWEELKSACAAAGVAEGAAVLVVEETAVVYGAAAGGAAAAGGTAAAGSTAAGAASAVVVKVVAGILAAAVTIGGAAALLLPKKEEPRQRVHPTQVDWAELPVLTAPQIAAIEDVLGDLEPGEEAKGEIIPDCPAPEDVLIPEGQLCNAEYIGDDLVILSGENAKGVRMEVMVEQCRDGWQIQSVRETAQAKMLYPISDAMREKGVPTVPCGWQLTNNWGLSEDGAYCQAAVLWRQELGHVDFCVMSQGETNGWYLLVLVESDFFETESYDGPLLDSFEINRETLEVRRQDISTGEWIDREEETAELEVTEPEVTEPEVTEPQPTEPVVENAPCGDVALTPQTLHYINRVVSSMVLPVPGSGPAIPYKQGSEIFPMNTFVTGCAGVNGLLQGEETPDGLVVTKSDVEAFLMDTLGWVAPIQEPGYPEIVSCGEDAYLIKNYSGDEEYGIRIHNIYAESPTRIRVRVPWGYTSYDYYFEQNSDSTYGWILTEAVDAQEEVFVSDVMYHSLMTYGVVVPGDGSATLTGISYSGELTMEAAEAFIRYYLLQTQGEAPAQVAAEDWGLIANGYYTYMVHVKDAQGADTRCYLIGTTDSAIAEYLGPNVPREWFQWEVTE